MSRISLTPIIDVVVTFLLSLMFAFIFFTYNDAYSNTDNQLHSDLAAHLRKQQTARKVFAML